MDSSRNQQPRKTNRSESQTASNDQQFKRQTTWNDQQFQKRGSSRDNSAPETNSPERPTAAETNSPKSQQLKRLTALEPSRPPKTTTPKTSSPKTARFEKVVFSIVFRCKFRTGSVQHVHRAVSNNDTDGIKQRYRRYQKRIPAV